MNPTALVTGGGNGIGKALCLELAKRNYQIAIVDISEQEAELVAQEVRDIGSVAFAMGCDVTDEDSIKSLVSTAVAKFDHIDLVFSNAGAAVRRPVAEFTRKDLEWIFSLNVFGMWDIAAQFGQRSIETNKASHIVVTGSEHSIGLPHAGNAAYTATKHAMLAVAECMRDEWADLPPSVSILCPGLTQSRFWEGERHRDNPTTKPNPRSEAVLAAGMPAAQLAKIAVDGAEAKAFYIFTHPHAEAYAKARYEAVESGFRNLNESTRITENYDVETVIENLQSDKP